MFFCEIFSFLFFSLSWLTPQFCFLCNSVCMEVFEEGRGMGWVWTIEPRASMHARQVLDLSPRTQFCHCLVSMASQYFLIELIKILWGALDQIYIFLKCKMLRIVGTLQCLTASIVGLNGLYMTFDVYKVLRKYKTGSFTKSCWMCCK